MRKLNSTKAGTAKSADYHITFVNGRYRIYDKQQRFRCEFATLPAAKTYIDSRCCLLFQIRLSTPARCTLVLLASRRHERPFCHLHDFQLPSSNL